MDRTRREFLELTAVGVVGLVVGCGDDVEGTPDAGAPTEDAATDAAAVDAARVGRPDDTAESPLFGLGVASGDVLERRAVVWTRYDGDAALALVVWEMNGDVYGAVAWYGEPAVAEGGFVHADVDGLVGGAQYRYAFFELDGTERVARSPIGRFRAALPAGSLERVVVGAVSCARNGREFPTLEHAGARGDLDLFLLAGDTVYANAPGGLAEFRARWAENLDIAGYRALLPSTSVAATWDDHEVDNNWDPESVDPDLLAAATRAMFEHLPLRADADAPARLYKKLRWGRALEVFVLDCRGERLPSTRTRADAQYISPAQLQWLQQGLLASDAVFKVIVNSVPIGNFPPLFDLAADNRWEGYAAQRDAILRFIDDNAIPGIIWVSGDFHFPSVGYVDTGDAPGAAQLEVLVGPAAQTPNPLGLTLDEPQFLWAAAQNSYTVFDFDPVAGQVGIEVFGEDGASLYAGAFNA